MQLCTPSPCPLVAALSSTANKGPTSLFLLIKALLGWRGRRTHPEIPSSFGAQRWTLPIHWQIHSGSQSCRADLLVMPHITCTAPRENAPGCHLFKSASLRNSAVSKSPKCLQLCSLFFFFSSLHLIGKVEDSIKNDF